MSSKYKSCDKLDDVSHILVSNNLGIFGSSEFRLNYYIDNRESQIPGFFDRMYRLIFRPSNGIMCLC